MINAWPNGIKRAMTQCEHERWNASNYPGTKQLCANCNEPTGTCEEDSRSDDNGNGPLCLDCYRYLTKDADK